MTRGKRKREERKGRVRDQVSLSFFFMSEEAMTILGGEEKMARNKGRIDYPFYTALLCSQSFIFEPQDTQRTKMKKKKVRLATRSPQS